MRVFGILAGYEDQNDHDTLRSDPVFKLVADRSPQDAHPARQPTLSRFENRIGIRSLLRPRAPFVDQFIASFAQPPRSPTFDLDAVDDPTHGAQQPSLSHGFYEQYQYLPLIRTSADTDQTAMLSPRHGDGLAGRRRRPGISGESPARPLAHGADPGARRRGLRQAGDAGRVRASKGRLHLRFVGPRRVAAARRGFAGGRGARLRGNAHAATMLHGVPVSGRFLAGAALADRQGGGQRPGDEPALRRHESAGASVCLEATYDEYAMRGESENRNKELKCGLGIDRLSDPRFVATCSGCIGTRRRRTFWCGGVGRSPTRRRRKGRSVDLRPSQSRQALAPDLTTDPEIGAAAPKGRQFLHRSGMERRLRDGRVDQNVRVHKHPINDRRRHTCPLGAGSGLPARVRHAQAG